MNVSFLQELLNSVAEQGRQSAAALAWRGRAARTTSTSWRLALVSSRGEASGVAIAREILQRYRTLSTPTTGWHSSGFWRAPCSPTQTRSPAPPRHSSTDPARPRSGRLQRAVESPRLEFFRRLNLAPGATAAIVAMRRDLLAADDPSVAPVDSDLRHLLVSWFNRGFLVLRRIDWQTPATILDKIIAYEAVHEIQGWDDLRRRLDPADRRCFAFFHPSLVDEPLIFVEVALMGDIPESIGAVLQQEAPRNGDVDEKPTTAVFYSISNCQEGLRGISFGNFLIKQVVEDLVKERPSLKTFVTLSPVPNFADWLASVLSDRGHRSGHAGRAAAPGGAARSRIGSTASRSPQPSSPCCCGLPRTTSWSPRPATAVRSIRWPASISAMARGWNASTGWAIPRPKGLAEAHGLMVNYRYELKDIERNHEAYANEGTVAASRQVHGFLKAERARPEARKLLQIAGLRPGKSGPEQDESK